MDGSAKERVEALLRTLPDDCSLEEIRYHLYVLGRVEARQRLGRWLAEAE
jgi:hypothetical protein